MTIIFIDIKIYSCQYLILKMLIICLTCLLSRKHAQKSEGYVNNMQSSVEFSMTRLPDWLRKQFELAHFEGDSINEADLRRNETL